MATYSELKYSSFTDLVVPFTTDNGVGEFSAGTQVLTGYTLGITQFTFTPVLSTLESTGFGVSLDKMIWDFGDGTYGTGYSVTKQYEFPGEYTVRTIFTDQNGVTHRNSREQRLKVYNYIPDTIQWFTPNIAYPNGGLPEMARCGCPSDDLTLFRYNSWQSWPMVSGDGGYNINLYSMGSQSMPLSQERYYKSPDIHFTPTWRFVESKTSTVPIERVHTTNSMIYVKMVDGQVVHTDEADPDGVFAGTSGIATVNYIDDQPNRMISRRPAHRGNNSPARFENENLDEQEFELLDHRTEAKDIILYASFDTSRFPVTRYDKEIAGFEKLKKDYFQIYETQRIGLPIIVKLNEPASLSITSNGINGFDIDRNKYINSPISFCVQVAGRNGFPICTTEIPQLSSRWSATTENFSAGDITTDVLTGQGFVSLYLSGTDTTFTRVITSITSSEDFKFWDVGKMVATNPSNSYVKLNIVERCAEDDTHKVGKDIFNKSYRLTPNTVTLLPGTFDQSTFAGLKNLVDSDRVYDLRLIARNWTTREGDTYYAVMSDESTYGDPDVIEMGVDKIDVNGGSHGAYTGLFNLETSSQQHVDSRYKLVAETIIDPPLYFNMETLYYYMSNPSNDFFHQVKPVNYRNYTYGEHGFTQTYTSPLTTQTPGNSGLYGFAVEPNGDAIMVDGDTDRIIRYWRNREFRHEVEICNLLPDVSANHYPGDPEEYGYSPSSVSLDSDLNYWVTLYDAVSTIKIDGKTNKVIACATPPVDNYVADPRQTSYEGRPPGLLHEGEFMTYEVEGKQGEYGENLVKPTKVETCKNDDIVVSYSNTLCSFLVRYDKNGNVLSKCDFGQDEDRVFTGDICIDVSDHVWAVTDGTSLTPDGSGSIDIPRGMIHSYDEQLNFRLAVSSVAGADYQDILSPTPSYPEEISFDVLMSTTWDYVSSVMVTDAFILADFGPNAKNPPLTVYEDNTYTFDNKFWNKGQHQLVFKEITPEQQGTIYSNTLVDDLDVTGETIYDNVSGHDGPKLSIEITSNTPDQVLLVDKDYPQNKILMRVIKKPVYTPREGDTFDIFDNPSFVTPDCNNNIWFSWGRRFVSRYNTLTDRVDTTVAVGSAYDDPRYDNIDESTHERRDNAGRRSAIEGLGMDTGNNILVINNADKRLYALYSENPPVSAYVNMPNSQIPYQDFSWMGSVSSDETVDALKFTDGTSHLTDEQIEVFLANASTTRGKELTNADKLAAADNYVKVMDSQLGDVVFRTTHALNGVSAVGLEQEIVAGGDWTGFQWINKYDERYVYSDASSGAVSLTGASAEFRLLPQQGMYDVTRINEDKDFAGVIREYVRMPGLVEKKVFFEDFLDTVFGTDGTSPINLGKRIYERITNFASNHNDIDTCTLQALISLAEMTDYKLTEFGTSMPAELQRIVDIMSVKFTKLRGARTDYQVDFEKYGNWDQNTIGVNLGSEIMFIYDYDPAKSYAVEDIVRMGGEYYQAVGPVPPSTAPEGTETTQYWKHWSDGYIRPKHLDELKSIFKPYMDNDRKYNGETVTDEWIVRMYEKQNVMVKLVERLLVELDSKYVLREETSGKYSLVEGRAQNFLEQRIFNFDLEDNDYVVTAPGSADHDVFDEDRRHNEIVSDIQVADELVTLDGKTITVMAALEHINPTLVLYRDRTYKFNVDSVGHGMEIVTDLDDATRLQGFVTGQGTELGTMILRTDTDETYGAVPDVLYYRSVKDPNVSGMIKIKDVNDVNHYSTTFRGVTAYNIDITYNKREQLQRLGWGVDIPEGANAWQYYSIYEYVSSVNTDQEYIGNVIEWPEEHDPNSIVPETTVGRTTIKYDDTKSYKEWSRDGGVVDVVIEKTLREGLGLFDGLDPLDDHYN